MKTYKLTTFNRIYLNSFRPLCMTEMGRVAVKNYGYPSFIDASYRREPDLQNHFPTISAICRQGLFAPRLKVDDIVVYMTVKRRYYSDKQAGNKLVAFLRVVEIFESHQKGYDWFIRNSLKVPSNCMVISNLPFGFDHTAGNFETVRQMKAYLNRDSGQRALIAKRRVDIWDNTYRQKAGKWPMFVRTEPIHIEYNDPVTLLRGDLEGVFGSKILNTRNPKAITPDQLKKLGLIAGVDIQFH